MRHMLFHAINQYKRNLLLGLFTGILAFIPRFTHSQVTKSILFIGNSYTYCWDMPMITDLMARSTGNTLNYSVSAIGGYTLEQHRGNATTLGLIRQGGWDFVALQEYSQYPSEPWATFQNITLPYVEDLNNEINTYNPNAETIFYMTWGRKNGDAARCARLPEVCTYVGMDDLTRARYEYMASAYHGIVNPAGAVWRYIRQNYPGIELYDTDESHPIAAGAYATACAFYTTIFRKDPTLITYNYILSNDDAAKIRTAAKAVVYDNLMYWHIGEYDIVDTQAPSVPAGLNATNKTETGFTLGWTASTDNVAVAEYLVYQDGVQIGTVIGTSLVVSDLTVGQTYAMTVKAKDRSGNISAASSALNVTTPDTHAPSVPSVLTAEDVTESSFTLNWNASSDNVAVTGYSIYLNGVFLKTVSGTSTAISGLSPSATYAITMTARDAAGNISALSTALIVNTPDTHAPGIPSGLASSLITTSGFTLSWNASTDNVAVTGYEVYRNGTLVETITGTSIGITGLSASTNYSMTVKAKDAAGNISAASAPLSVTTASPAVDSEAPSVPSGLTSGSITQTSFTVTWNASTDNVGVTSYDVYRNGTLYANTVGTSVSLTGLDPSTTYAMTVRANDLAGNHSAVSGVLNVLTLDPVAPDTQAPSVPAGLNATAVTETGFTLNWTASTDNVEVTGYNVYLNGTLYTTVSGTTAGLTGLIAGTIYQMTVSAKDAAGNTSAASSSLAVTTAGTAPDYEAPSVPVSLQAGSLIQSSFTLSWTASTDNVAVTQYEVYRNNSYYSTVSTNSATISGLSANNTYAMKVRAKDAAGNTSSFSSVLNVTTPDTEAPSIPSGLSYSNLGQASFTLNWNTSSDNVGVVGYDIYMNGTLVLTVTGNSAGIYDLSAKTSYSMTVRARDAAGNTSEASSVLSVTTLDTEPPTVPYNLSYSSLTQSSFTLSWHSSSDNIGVTGYIVYLDGVQYATPAGTSTSISGLSASTDYQLTVAARDASGNTSLPSSALSVTTPDTQAPTAPSGLSASNITQNSFTLNWLTSTDNVGVVAYLVYRNGTLVATVAGTAAGITDLTVNTTYTMTVKAKDAAGNLSSAGSLNVTTVDTESPTVPGSVVVSNLTQNAFTLSWSASSDNVGVTGYNIYRNGQLTNYSTTTSFNLTGLLASTTYVMTVKARDQVGNLSKPSDPVTVTTPDTDAPTVPSSLNVTNLKQDSFTLNWTVSTDNVGVTEYLVYQDGALDTTVVTATARISKLKASKGYSMTVKAKDKAGNLSAASAALKITTPDTEKPTLPLELQTSNVSETGLTLRWKPSKDNVRVTGYKVFQNGSIKTTVEDTVLVISDLQVYRNYSFSVEAQDSAGNLSGKSSTCHVKTTDVHKPEAPVFLLADQLGDKGFVLHWSRSSDNVGVKSYNVLLNGAKLCDQTDTTCDVSNLKAFTEYLLNVEAVDSAGNVSSRSYDLVVKTTDSECPSVPSGLTAVSVLGDAFTVKWEKATDNVVVESYQVFLDGINKKEVADTQAQITGLKPKMTYRVQVRAVDMAGNFSPLSDTLEVTMLPTGFADVSKGMITVYPNPVTANLVSIDLGEIPDSGVQVELLDQRGSLVYAHRFTGHERKLEVQPPDGMPGNYVLRVIIGQRIFVQKLVFDIR